MNINLNFYSYILFVLATITGISIFLFSVFVYDYLIRESAFLIKYFIS